jgi:hypothetical protein
MSVKTVLKDTSSPMDTVSLAQLTQPTAELPINANVQQVSSPMNMEFVSENVEPMRFMIKPVNLAIA